MFNHNLLSSYTEYLPTCFQSRSLAAIIGAIGVKFYFHIRLNESARLWETELQVFDVQASVNPLLLVVSTDAQDLAYFIVLFCRKSVVEIVRAKLYREMVFLHHKVGVGEEEVGVGLEMNQSVVAQEVTIASQEVGGSEPFGDFLHLWVGESEPDFRHLIRCKKLVDKLNVGAQKAHVLQPCLFGFGGAAPHPCPLDVHTDEVLVGEEASEPHTVFSTSTAQFEDDGCCGKTPRAIYRKVDGRERRAFERGLRQRGRRWPFR